MGKQNKTSLKSKSGKGSKDRKKDRKIADEKYKQSKAIVDAAKAVEDPLAPFAVFASYKKSNLDATIKVLRCAQLTDQLKKDLFTLTKDNMETLYKQTESGWSDRDKKDEMFEEEAMYLVATAPDGKLLGYSHFRFDMDYGTEVLYCYELHIERGCQHKGLGKHLLQILELMAFKVNMMKVVLTVFKNNTAGQKFFRAMKYDLDETCPVDNELDEDDVYEYEILCKMNKMRLKREAELVKPLSELSLNQQTSTVQ